MIGVIINIVLVLNSLFSFGALGILQSGSDPVSLLWSLTNFAIQSRQSLPHVYQNNYESYHPSNNFLPNTQILMEALHTIFEKDDHHCVPKLLCEVAAGKDVFLSNGRELSLSPSFQVDMDSLFGLLSTFETQNTPILLLGKAVLLGYRSKGSPDACTYAYPRCPSNPDVLLNYLNNYNGGFFRYFNSIKPSYSNQNNVFDSSSSSTDFFQNYPSYQQDYGYRYSKERYGTYPANKFKYITNLKFPYHDRRENIEEYQSKINFPEYDFDNEPKNPEFIQIYTTESYRDGKRLSFPEDYEDHRDEKYHQIVHSDRTGTGELLVDTRNF